MPTASKPLIYLCFLKSYNYTPTMQSVLIGSEYPVMDTLLFYFLKSSYCKAFRGVAECYAFSCFHDNVGLRDLPAIWHIESADAVVAQLAEGGCAGVWHYLRTPAPRYFRALPAAVLRAGLRKGSTERRSCGLCCGLSGFPRPVAQ